MKGKYLKNEDIALIADALSSNTSLKNLCLANCSISNSGAASLGKALEKNSNLTCLDLENNKIGSEGIADIADGLTNNKGLLELTLLGNTTPGEGAMTAFVNALEVNTTLQSIKWRVSSRQSFKINSSLTRNKEIVRRINAGLSIDDIDPQKMRERDERIRAEHDAKFSQTEHEVDTSQLTTEQIAEQARLAREAELKRIEEERKKKGTNVFQQMAQQQEEERKRRLARFTGSSDVSSEPEEEKPKPEPISTGKLKDNNPFAEMEKKKDEKVTSPTATETTTSSNAPSSSPGKIKTNPFLEMERKREEERRARFARFSKN